jgi:CheY-like chemotaxis protein
VSAPLLLLVEDDVDVREALAALLRDAGYDVCCAADGFDAIHVLRRGARPAAILLDLMLPGMDGFEFRAEQLRDPEVADIPVIVLTADRAIERSARELRAADHLAKPASVDDLLRSVGRIAGGAGAGAFS